MKAYGYLCLALHAYPAPRALSALVEAMEKLRHEDPARWSEVFTAERVATVLAGLDIEQNARCRIECILDDLRRIGSEDALRALIAVARRVPYYVEAFGFAVECAQARAGTHPCAWQLFVGMTLGKEGLRFSGPAWSFWGERSEEAIRAAKEGFWGAIRYSAGLLDEEPEFPESIAPDRLEPDGPIAQEYPEELKGLIWELEEAEGEDDEIEALRAIADAEAGGAFAAVDERLWSTLSDELKALAEQKDVTVGARLGALIDVALGCANDWRQADRVRKSLIEALCALCSPAPTAV